MMNYVGNISTILKYIIMTISGYAIALLATKGINLPITEQQIAQIAGIIVAFIIAHIDATNPNTFSILGNAVKSKIENNNEDLDEKDIA